MFRNVGYWVIYRCDYKLGSFFLLGQFYYLEDLENEFFYVKKKGINLVQSLVREVYK